MLSDAQLLFEQGRVQSAADRAYYSMFHAAQAALVVAGVKAARTHKGLRSQFGEYLVVPGLIEREHGKALTAAHEIRQESTYEAYALEDAEEVRNLIASANRFLNRIEKFVAERRT